MFVAEAHVKSELASRYLVQLCKHFAHKRPTDYDAHSGRVNFQPGLCIMRAEDDNLVLSCQAQTEDTLNVVKQVVEVHLARFAAREDISVRWQQRVDRAPPQGGGSEPHL